MTQLESCVNQGHEQKAYKLKRSIFRLKQVSRSSNIRFDNMVKFYGFEQNVDEP